MSLGGFKSLRLNGSRLFLSVTTALDMSTRLCRSGRNSRRSGAAEPGGD